MPNIIDTLDFGDGVERQIQPQTDSALSTTSENPVQNKVITSEIQTLTNQAENKVLYLTGIACSATTGNFVSYSNSAITADHVLAECVFANPLRITSTDVTWTTASGSLVLNGTCSTATTVNVVLVKKDN